MNQRLLFVWSVVALMAAGARGVTNTWTGNGDANNSGNWSDGNNWSGAAPGALDSAALPEVTANGNDGVASRTVTNNAVTTVNELLMTQSNGSYPNQIILTADLSVGRVAVSPDSDAGINASRVNVNGRTLTVGLNDQKSRAGGGRGMPYCSGTGTIVKVGTNEVGLSYNPTIGFTGTYRIDNGYLVGNYGRIQGTVVVNTGGTYRITADGGENRPLALRGFGFASNGAFRVECTMTRSAGIAISNDASIYVSGSYVLTQQGVLSGTGRLYKAGTGKLLLTANNSAFTNGVVVSAGTLEVSGLLSGSQVTVQSNAVLVAPAYRVGTVTVESGGIWSNTASAVWIKGASSDGNDDGCWSDSANWATAEVPTNLAILGDVTGNGNDGTSTRTVSNVAPLTVTTLEMRQTTAGFINKLKLCADALMGTIVLNPDTDAARQLCQIDVNGRTLIVGSNDARVANYPALAGGGTVIKMGTNYAQFSYSPGYTWNGVYVLKGGRTYLVYNRVSGIRYWVQNGGCLHIDSTSILNYSGNEVAIEGNGYANYGSLYVSGTVPGASFTAPLVVTNDTALRVDAGQTLSLNGPLRGPGTLTMGGGGTLDLNGTWTCRFTGTAINGIVVTNGTVDIAGCTLAVTNTAGITSGQYVLVDYSSPSGALTGRFAVTNGLPPNWRIADRGRRLMLLPPPTGLVFTFR